MKPNGKRPGGHAKLQLNQSQIRMGFPWFVFSWYSCIFHATVLVTNQHILFPPQIQRVIRLILGWRRVMGFSVKVPFRPVVYTCTSTHPFSEFPRYATHLLSPCLTSFSQRLRRGFKAGMERVGKIIAWLSFHNNFTCEGSRAQVQVMKTYRISPLQGDLEKKYSPHTSKRLPSHLKWFHMYSSPSDSTNSTAA